MNHEKHRKFHCIEFAVKTFLKVAEIAVLCAGVHEIARVHHRMKKLEKK